MPSAPAKRARPAPKTVVKSTEPREIKFYRANEKPFGVLSNLYKRPVVFEEVEYPTSEHAYQAGKASRPAVREWILAAPTPALAAMAAHNLYTWDVVSDWSKIKFDRMRQVLRAKFSQHEDLALVLLSTGEARLVEEGTVDNAVNRLWGEVRGKGENMLGKMLMELRDELRRAQAVEPTSNKKKSLKGPKARGANKQKP